VNRLRNKLSLLSVCLAALAGGCTVGPNYNRPSATVPAHWDVQEPWRQSTPGDSIPKGDWWSVFSDEQLNSLEKECLAANQTLKTAAAHLDQARATAQVQLATQYPQVGTTPSAERQRISGNRPLNGSPIPLTGPATQNVYTLPFNVSYEVDLFGRRRRAIEAAQASYQANAADFQNTNLVVTAELAADYFTLRQLDSEIGILNRTVDTLQRGLDLVISRHNGGIASGLDVAQEETLLDTTRTQAILLQQQRKQFEDAIAALVGKPAPDFHLASMELGAEPPSINTGLPSDLLERRPDIAEAERNMQVANAQIGIAKAAYYPSLVLYGSGGWQSADISQIMNGASGLWAIGANVAESIFAGGARRAQTQFAQAGYDATVSTYRDTVLNAFREVQDSVTGLQVLESAQKAQQLAVEASDRTVNLATDRYKGGLVSYLDVVNAQQNYLTNQQQMAVIQGQRLVTSVLLVKALGGGWDASSLAAIRAHSSLKDIVAP